MSTLEHLFNVAEEMGLEANVFRACLSKERSYGCILELQRKSEGSRDRFEMKFRVSVLRATPVEAFLAALDLARQKGARPMMLWLDRED